MLIHCTMGELIAIRDGQGSEAARQHLEGCDRCMAEMELLHQRVASLKALPNLRPPRDRWLEIQTAVAAERRKKLRTFAGWSSMAAAASIALLVGIGTAVIGHRAQSSELVDLIEESQHLESILRTIKPAGRVMNGRMVSTVVQLEDRIARLDEVLEEFHRGKRVGSDELENLWRRRIQLMDALVTTHTVRTASYVGF